MLALHARALLSINVARVAGNELQLARRVAAADDAARDSLLLSRIDPTNVVTVHNLGVARNNGGEALFDLGRPREAMAKHIESNEALAKVAPRSSMVTSNLSGRYNSAAWIAGELGQTALADKYKAEGFRLYRAWVKSLFAGSYEAELWARSEPVFEAEYAVAKGDFDGAREETKGAREGLLQLKPGDDPGRRRQQAFFLRRLHAALGRVELESKDFVAAERHYRYVAEARRSLNEKTMSQRRLDSEDTARWALALARSGRLDEARPKAAQALAFERELHASKPDDQLHKWNLTVALVASAYANPQQANTLLAEAQAVFDTLPADARALRTGRWTESLITEARRTLR